MNAAQEDRFEWRIVTVEELKVHPAQLVLGQVINIEPVDEPSPVEPEPNVQTQE